ncbi:DUF5684 domain-containing protein [Eubacterium multiforme]|uniref:Uncharacterized protein n=1 Tax=Eubacterium multiforme TaxID=83339 RepID=A0ABT9US68_9FIRM|nr:DUF5684 domain-containing protein [Eubacterium multiforme]MDQ0149162.1 hypothetical protein [Eubacterium multiforme]
MTYFQNIYFGSFGLILGIIFYIIRVYPSYIMAKKANLKNPWMMLIPILGELQMLHLAGLSYWYFLLSFIPFVNFIFSIIVFYRIMKNFGFGLGMTILGIIFSFIAFLTFWYIVITNRNFVGDIPEEYQEY